MIIRPTSVIVCTHNRADRLPSVIGQLRAQDYPHDAFEIIVVDSCSTDHTPQIVKRFVNEPGVPVRYVVENRPGITFARNRGAEEARYPYLAYLDDDCSVYLDWLSQLISGFNLDDHIVVVGGRIMVDYDDQEKPSWLCSKSERWLGAYNHPSSQSCLLEFPLYVCEGNMALLRSSWKAVDGFLGMDQVGSPHIAAQEIVILLKQIERQGGKVAFAPRAIVHHHPGLPTWKWIVRRAYLHGVSDGILEYVLYRRSWSSAIYSTVVDTAAMFIFLCWSLLFLLLLDSATAMYHFLRATARFGKILSKLHLAGDWRRVRIWVGKHQYGMENETLL